MTVTLHTRTQRAEHRSRLAFAKADAAIAGLPDATIRSAGGLGRLIISAAANAASDPVAQAKGIQAQLQADVDAALAELDAAAAEAESLQSVAKYLADGAHLPEKVDPVLKAQAAQVRQAHLAGLLDARSVAADVERYVSTAAAEVGRLQKTLGESTRSAARVVSAKALHSAYIKAGLPRAAEVQALRVKRVTALHRSKFEFTDRPRPRTAKRFAQEATK